MIELYQNPMGETDISTVGTTGNKYLDSTNQGNSEDQVKIDQLKQTIQSLKRDIADVSYSFYFMLRLPTNVFLIAIFIMGRVSLQWSDFHTLVFITC